MSTTSQQLCFQAEEDSKRSTLECSLNPTFGRPKLPNRKIPVDDQAAPYYQLWARKPYTDSLRKTYALLAKYPIGYSENMDEATRNANFLEFCSLAQIIQYKHDDFIEWEREIALEKYILYQYVLHKRKKLDVQSFFKWLENHDQAQMEYKLARNKAVLHNLDPEKVRDTQEHMARRCREHKRQVEAEKKRKDFQCTIEAQMQSAGHTKQFATAEDQKGSSKTIKPRIESKDSSKRQEAEYPKRHSEESDSPKARINEEIQQELLEKVRAAAAKCAKSSPSDSTSTPDPIAPSIRASATPRSSPPALPSLSKSFASAQTSLSTSTIQRRTLVGPSSPLRGLSPSPSTEGASRDSASSGPASPYSLSIPCTTRPSTRKVSPPEASTAIATLSNPPAEPKSSASAMSGQGQFFLGSPSKPRSRLPPLPIVSAGPPQPLPFMQHTGPRHRPTPLDWVEPLTLCNLVVSNMPYVPVKQSEAMMPPTETVLMLPHTSIFRTLAAAMHVHPSLLFQQCPLPILQDRPREADAKEIEYLIYGLRAWWYAIFPKSKTRDESFARMRERDFVEEPLREAFERAEKAEVKLMAKMVWGLVREREPKISVSWEGGEKVRKWLGWKEGELGFWD